MPKEKREFVGGPWDGQTREVDAVSVLPVQVEEPDGTTRLVKYYLGADGRYHFELA